MSPHTHCSYKLQYYIWIFIKCDRRTNRQQCIWAHCAICKGGLNKTHLIENMCNENTRVSHLPWVDGVERSPNRLDLDHVTLTYNRHPCYIWPWPTALDLDLCDLDPPDLDLGPPFLILAWKLEFLHFWPWWPWPLTFKLVRYMICVCQSLGL